MSTTATAPEAVTSPNPEDIVAAPATEVTEITVAGVMAQVPAISFSPIDASLSKEDRIAEIQRVLVKTVEAGGRLQMIQAELLCEVQTNGYWKEWTATDTGEKFTKFDQYVEQELGLARRTTFSRMQTYRAFVLEGGLTHSDFDGVNWSVVGLVTPHANKENARQLLEGCKGLTFKQGEKFRDALKTAASVEDAINIIKAPKLAAPAAATDSDVTAAPAASAASASAGGASNPAEDVKTLKVTMAVAQFQNITDAIAAAKAAYGTDSDAAALDIIATEWMASNPSTANMTDEERIAAAIKIAHSLETNFGVSLQVTGIATTSSGEDAIL